MMIMVAPDDRISRNALVQRSRNRGRQNLLLPRATGDRNPRARRLRTRAGQSCRWNRSTAADQSHRQDRQTRPPGPRWCEFSHSSFRAPFSGETRARARSGMGGIPPHRKLPREMSQHPNRPGSRVAMPASILSRVLLPAPFPPTTQSDSPRMTEKLTSRDSQFSRSGRFLPSSRPSTACAWTLPSSAGQSLETLSTSTIVESRGRTRLI